MFFATINKPKRLLYLCYIDHVSAAELERGYEELKALLEEFPSGYRMLTDMVRLESVDLNAVDIIGKSMELLEQKGLEMIVRVVPDSSKRLWLQDQSEFFITRAGRGWCCARPCWRRRGCWGCDPGTFSSSRAVC